MRAGDLRHQLVLQRPSAPTRDAVGGATIVWTDYVTVWGAVEPLAGREYFSAQQVQSETDIRFRIRYRSDVTDTWRVMWDSRPYNITAVIDLKADHTELHLMAKSQING